MASGAGGFGAARAVAGGGGRFGRAVAGGGRRWWVYQTVGGVDRQLQWTHKEAREESGAFSHARPSYPGSRQELSIHVEPRSRAALLTVREAGRGGALRVSPSVLTPWASRAMRLLGAETAVGQGHSVGWSGQSCRYAAAMGNRATSGLLQHQEGLPSRPACAALRLRHSGS